MSITLRFVCNDPGSGEFVGKFEYMEVEGDECAASLHGPMTVIGFDKERLQIGRTKVPFSSEAGWCGTWSWSAWEIESAAAAKVLAYLRRRGFKCEADETVFFEGWNAAGPLTAAEIEDLITSQLEGRADG